MTKFHKYVLFFAFILLLSAYLYKEAKISIPMVKTAYFAQVYPNQVFHQGDPTKSMIALTFDDGPDNHYTPLILDILQKKNVHAAFSIILQHCSIGRAENIDGR
ncbi:MAG: polysaccharide deacetylase family protein [Desulfitobacterium hafniense]|nr:polysaccharide deacetylase family protein [Desulfitobacterium hafniense]